MGLNEVTWGGADIKTGDPQIQPRAQRMNNSSYIHRSFGKPGTMHCLVYFTFYESLSASRFREEHLEAQRNEWSGFRQLVCSKPVAHTGHFDQRLRSAASITLRLLCFYARATTFGHLFSLALFLFIFFFYPSFFPFIFLGEGWEDRVLCDSSLPWPVMELRITLTPESSASSS